MSCVSLQVNALRSELQKAREAVDEAARSHGAPSESAYGEADSSHLLQAAHERNLDLQQQCGQARGEIQSCKRQHRLILQASDGLGASSFISDYFNYG